METNAGVHSGDEEFVRAFCDFAKLRINELAFLLVVRTASIYGRTAKALCCSFWCYISLRGGQHFVSDHELSH